MPALTRFAVDILRVYLHRGFATAQRIAHEQDLDTYRATRRQKVKKMIAEFHVQPVHPRSSR